ncbi:MAG: hypothetical protein Q8P33_01455 [bacterium]|nr:hypothetical protein [bacterium]
MTLSQQPEQTQRHLLAVIVVIIAGVHALLFGYWMVRTALPLTLSQAGIKPAQEIFDQHDPYQAVRSFLSQRKKSNQLAGLVLVGERVSPPSRFDLEVYYELYPVLPIKVARGSNELAGLVKNAQRHDAFISDSVLELDPTEFDLIAGQDAHIYIKR